MHQLITAATSPHPPPPAPGYCGAFANSALPGRRAFADPGYSQPFDTHAVSYQNVTTLRILLEIFKQAYWRNYQGQEKIEEGCKDMFSILCMHFFFAYQARITLRNWELTGRESKFN